MWPFKTKPTKTSAPSVTPEAEEAVVIAPTIIGKASTPDYRFHRATQRGARLVAKIERELAKGTPEKALVALRKELRVCEAQALLEQIKQSATGEV